MGLLGWCLGGVLGVAWGMLWWYFGVLRGRFEGASGVPWGCFRTAFGMMVALRGCSGGARGCLGLLGRCWRVLGGCLGGAWNILKEEFQLCDSLTKTLTNTLI